jgi:hypothetical protein
MAEQGDGPGPPLLANDDEVFLVPTSVPVERLGTLDILSRPWSLAPGAIDSSSDPSVIAAETGTSIVVFDTTSSNVRLQRSRQRDSRDGSSNVHQHGGR